MKYMFRFVDYIYPGQEKRVVFAEVEVGVGGGRQGKKVVPFPESPGC